MAAPISDMSCRGVRGVATSVNHGYRAVTLFAAATNSVGRFPMEPFPMEPGALVLRAWFARRWK
jgi:hypothetical protein